MLIGITCAACIEAKLFQCSPSSLHLMYFVKISICLHIEQTISLPCYL
nr:MAG TPA: hypothetical protein [Caudoviricetes sp.]